MPRGHEDSAAGHEDASGGRGEWFVQQLGEHWQSLGDGIYTFEQPAADFGDEAFTMRVSAPWPSAAA